MNVTVQVIGAPEDVAILLLKLGQNKDGVITDLVFQDSNDNGDSYVSENSSSDDSELTFDNIPDANQYLMDSVIPSEDSDNTQPSVTYAQLQHALKSYGLRYQQRHDSELKTVRDVLLLICEKVGGAGKDEGSKGIKKDKYNAVYDFLINDNEL